MLFNQEKERKNHCAAVSTKSSYFPVSGLYDITCSNLSDALLNYYAMPQMYLATFQHVQTLGNRQMTFLLWDKRARDFPELPLLSVNCLCAYSHTAAKS